MNGRLDELGYERGGIDTSLTFEALREASDITEKARRGTSFRFSRLPLTASTPTQEQSSRVESANPGPQVP